MKYKYLFITIILTLCSCKNDDNKLINCESIKEDFFSMNFYYEKSPGEDILSYEGIIDGYQNYFKENRFYNYLFEKDNRINKYYYVYLNENIINKYENENIKYSYDYIDGYFFEKYSLSKEFNINNLKLCSSDNFKFKNKYNNYILVACYETSLITLKNNYSLKKEENLIFEFLNNVIIENKKDLNTIIYYDKNEYFVSGENDILNTKFINSSFFGISYSIYKYGNFISQIYNIDNKKYIKLQRYDYNLDGNKIDLLDKNINFKENFVNDYFGIYKDEFLSAYYKDIAEDDNYAYFSLDILKEYMK